MNAGIFLSLPPVLRSVGMSSMSTDDDSLVAAAGDEGICLITGLVGGGGENLKWLPCTAAAAAAAAAWSWPWVSVRWWKLVEKALGDGGGIIELPLLYVGDEDESCLAIWSLLLLVWVSGAGGGCCRSREMFLMFFSSVGLRRNLKGANT